MADDLLLIGRIARAHGIRGQMVVQPETDFAEDRFRAGNIMLVGVEAKPMEITSARFHQGRPIIALEGVETMNEANGLAGSELRIDESELPALPDGTFRRHELVGCEVRDVDGGVIGEVAAVEGPMEMSRLVINAPQGEILIPLVADICVEVAPAEKRISVKVPEGLLDVNAKRR